MTCDRAMRRRVLGRQVSNLRPEFRYRGTMRAEDRVCASTGYKRLRHSRRERCHQNGEQSDEAAELADEATAHESDDGFQSE
jgi:hypothetical protein